MKVLFVLIPCVKAWHIYFECIISLNKLCDDKASHINIFTNKLDNSDNATILWDFLTHFAFKSVLSSNTRSWLADIYYSWGVAEVLPVISLPILFISSQLLFLLHDKHFETNEKNSNRTDESITIHRLSGGSRAAGTSKMECFVVIVNAFQPLTINTKHSILDVVAALYPPLRLVWWAGWIHFLFSSLLSLQKTAFDLLAFCSLQRD